MQFVIYRMHIVQFNNEIAIHGQADDHAYEVNNTKIEFFFYHKQIINSVYICSH